MQSRQNTKQVHLAKPLCVLVIILILCNLITLHYLNKSVQRTSNMQCSNARIHSHHHTQQQQQQINEQTLPKPKFTNLLDADSPYTHLPYLPHNLNEHMHTNPNNLNDPDFINRIKQLTNPSNKDQTTLTPMQSLNSLQSIKSGLSITIEDEIRRNKITTNENLWNIEEENKSNIICDNSIEYVFNNTIHTLHKLKSRNYIESMICPNAAKLGWRHSSYVPFIFGNHCEPWWSRDAVYILSKLLNKNMIGIEWGTGSSSLWLSMLSNFTIAM